MSEWIKHNGRCDDVDVGLGTLIDVKFRSGKELHGVPAHDYVEDDGGYMSYYGTTGSFWYHDDAYNDIVAWRLSEECRSSYCECPVGECSGGKVDKRAEAAVELQSSIPNVNPKQQFGMSKLPMHLASPLATAYMAIGLGNGALKYGTANFKATPVLASIYIAGLKRHVDAWLEGEENDPDDGAPHLGAALANLAIIIEARANGTLIDDRPIGEGYLKEREMLTEIWQQIQQKHAGKQPHHFTRNNA